MTFFRVGNPLLNTFSADEARRIESEEDLLIVSQIPVWIETPAAILDRVGFVPEKIASLRSGDYLTPRRIRDATGRTRRFASRLRPRL